MHPPTNKLISQKLSVDMNVLLGKGSTGNVYQGLCLELEPHTVAVKVIPLEEINNEVTSYLLECELEALKATSKCPNQSIVKLQDIIVVENNCYIATELLEGGTLKDYITFCKKLEPSHILKGYKVLKENGIIHRDLKPDNIIFASNPNNGLLVPKIIDFGYCIVEKVQRKPKMYYNVGSPRYMSPQAYTDNKYSQKSDIWALGVVLYEMLTGNNFDKGKDIVETFKMIKQKGIPVPSSLNPQCRKILQNMLMLDPTKRSNCENVLNLISRGNAENQANPQNNALRPFFLPDKNIKEIKNAIMSETVLLAPGRSPTSKTTLILGSPMRGSEILTRSVGGFTINLSPQSKDNQAALKSNQFNFKLISTKVMNKTIPEDYKEGPWTDRKQKTSFIHNNQLPTNETKQINKALPLSSSEQNLHKVQEIQNKFNGQESIKRRLNVRETVFAYRPKEYEERVANSQLPQNFQPHLMASIKETAPQHTQQNLHFIQSHDHLTQSTYRPTILQPTPHGQGNVPHSSLQPSLPQSSTQIQIHIQHNQSNSQPQQQQQSHQNQHHPSQIHIENHQHPPIQQMKPPIMTINNQIIQNKTLGQPPQTHQNRKIQGLQQIISQSNHSNQPILSHQPQTTNSSMHHTQVQFNLLNQPQGKMSGRSIKVAPLLSLAHTQPLVTFKSLLPSFHQQTSPEILFRPKIIEQTHI